jgi:hypothetical protein
MNRKMLKTAAINAKKDGIRVYVTADEVLALISEVEDKERQILELKAAPTFQFKDDRDRY